MTNSQQPIFRMLRLCSADYCHYFFGMYFCSFDIYNIIWSYINIKQLFHIIIASLISTGILVIVVYMFKLNIRLRACLLFMAVFTLAVGVVENDVLFAQTFVSRRETDCEKGNDC